MNVTVIKSASNHSQSYSFFIIFLVILVEGFITISAEILTIRQLIPVVGNNVIVTSLIIGVFLLFLAYGYKKGGVYQQNFSFILKRNFFIASILLGIGLSYLFIQLFFNFIIETISANNFISLSLYLILITAPLVYFLGQTVPITMNYFSSELRTSRIGATVLHVSTIGSFLGAVCTTLVLMTFLGVAFTVFFNFGLLVILIIILSWPITRQVELLFVLLALGIIIWGVNITFEKMLFVQTNNYGNYQVEKNYMFKPNNVGNLLIINNSPSSFITPSGEVFPYIEFIQKILFSNLKLTNKKILVLGSGGFTLSAKGDFNNQITYVDIDSAIPTMVKNHFWPNMREKFIAEDARKFLQYSRDKYDVIVTDVFSNRYTIPVYLLTQEHMKNIKKALNQNGLAIFNIIANPTLIDNYSKRVDNTIRSVFGNCMVMPMEYGDATTNIIYVCKLSSQENDKVIYTDNYNQATFDFASQTKK